MTEHGWFHPDRGYWQTTGLPPDDILEGYPEGTQEVPVKPGADYALDEETLTWTDFPPVIDLAALKASLKARIDAAAEAERLKYITPGAGQAMTYSQKADEARRYLGAEAPAAADYPLLSAEIGITGATLADVAGVVMGAFQQWQIIGAQIEAARLGTKAAINAAETVAEAETAAAVVAWPQVPPAEEP